MNNTPPNKNMTFKKLRSTLPIAMCLMLSACGSLPLADTKLAVEIGGINYSDQPITYALSDPDNPASGAGEPVDPFGAGGVMCCFLLPANWQPGIKVRVQIFDTHRKPVRDDIVELPPYVDGKAGRLWAVYYQDGSVDVFSSENGPPHATWPGRVKGWPVPSLAYRRERWDLHIKLAADNVEDFEEMLREIIESPDSRALAAWNFTLEQDPQSLAGYSGPSDPKYRAMLKQHYESLVNNGKLKLQKLKASRP